MIKNKFKTVVLLALLTAILLWVGNLVGGLAGLAIAFILVIIFNGASFWYSDKIVLKMYRAKEANEKDNHRLYKIVREVSNLSGIPMPKVYIIPSRSPNAFATGRSPKRSAVAATEGILNLLNDSELKGVMAHEVSHIKHRDTLIQTVSGMIAGIISYVATMAQWAAIFGGFGGREGEGGSIVELLALIIIAPLAAIVVQLAVSRSREYMADEGAAKMLHTGQGLADALLKLETEIKHKPMRFGNSSTAHLFISNPFRNSPIMNLFSTHPSTKKRVERLRSF